jgi:tagatose 1,6-diphosphate aldolase
MSNSYNTVGKIRGLQATSSEANVFTILAFDHRDSFMRMLGGDAKYDQIVATKSVIVKALATHSSAILLDPLYSAGQMIVKGLLPRRVGLLVSVEESGYSGDPTERMTNLLDKWGVEKVKRMGADAVKILIYYHPEAGDTTHDLERLVQQVAEDCTENDLPLFLEPVTYSIDPDVKKESQAYASQREKLVLETARRLSKLGPDIMKMEFPVDSHFETDEKTWAKACEALSEASERPWALLSAGVDYDLFKRQVRVACQHGASGFIGGRALWKEALQYSGKEQTHWLEKVAAARLDELSEIANKYARPWTDFFPKMENLLHEGWYKAY